MRRVALVCLLLGLTGCSNCAEEKPPPQETAPAVQGSNSKPTRFAKPYQPSASAQFGGNEDSD